MTIFQLNGSYKKTEWQDLLQNNFKSWQVENFHQSVTQRCVLRSNHLICRTTWLGFRDLVHSFCASVVHHLDSFVSFLSHLERTVGLGPGLILWRVFHSLITGSWGPCLWMEITFDELCWSFQHMILSLVLKSGISPQFCPPYCKPSIFFWLALRSCFRCKSNLKVVSMEIQNIWGFKLHSQLIMELMS